MPEIERALAMFIDFENLALGFQGRRDRFDITRVLERIVEKGKIVAKKAYADWSRFSNFTVGLHEAAIELIEIPRRAMSGKNSADIRLCVDAMDLAYSKEHINTFVVVSGDSDFSPLVSKLKELGKHVIGLGMMESTSDLLRDNCDEFIYYEDLGRKQTLAPNVSSQLPELKRKAFELLMESLDALRRENKDVLWSSMIKDTIKRKKPSFNETFHGFRTFSELLEDAAREGLIELSTDKRSKTYVVTRFGNEMHGEAPPTPEHLEPQQPQQPRQPSAATALGQVMAAPTGVSAVGVVGGQTASPVTAMPAAPPMAAEAGALPPRKKSRRRRRRGGANRDAAAMNGTNGNGAAAHAGGPQPVVGFQPVEIPPGPGVRPADEQERDLPVIDMNDEEDDEEDLVAPGSGFADGIDLEPDSKVLSKAEPKADPKTDPEPLPAPTAEVEPGEKPAEEPEAAPAKKPTTRRGGRTAKPKTGTTTRTRKPKAAAPAKEE